MPIELNAEQSLVEMRLTRKMTLDQARVVLAVATTSIPGLVKAKYHRDEGNSIIEADVLVDGASLEEWLTIHAVVHVKLTYKVDMVRSSEKVRQKIGDRLQEVAQEYCASTIMSEIWKGRNERQSK